MSELTDWPTDGLESVPNCPVCGSDQRELLYSDLTDRVFNVAPGKWTLHQCAQCRSAYLDPRPNEATIGLAYADYYTHTAEDAPEALPKNPLVRQLHAWINDYMNAHYGLSRKPAGLGGRWLVPLVPSFKAKADTKMRHLPKPPAEGGRLLDVGFGNGGFLKLATEMGWQAEGIDFDPKAVALAKARGLNVRCASAADLSAQNEQFDIITLSHVIEHVHDPIALLNNLYRLLKPGGTLWLETPNLNSIGAKRFGRNWMALDPPRHLVLLNTASLKNCLIQAGFIQIQQQWNGMVLFAIFAQSTAIAQGKYGQDVVHQVMPSGAAVLAELRGIVQPAKREYITFIAQK
ncbi:MAG: class I SAM-dependent methyltransferase [Halothiobacillaceae bacterium]|nr:class I SAM-dependent methyltransferase [Halothiobacillaceae bacterium]